jgi:hypothetical protein
VNHVLDIIFIGREVPSATLKTLEVTRALQNELLADDRVFSLAKSELTAHLSAFIARSVAVSSVGSRGGHYRLSHGSAIGVMRKYALLAEFVAISARLSGFDRNTLDVDAIYNDYCDELRGRQRAKALRNIVDFDCSLSLLMEGLHLQLDIDREEHVDSADLHRRLICVTRELLDPLVIE